MSTTSEMIDVGFNYRGLLYQAYRYDVFCSYFSCKGNLSPGMKNAQSIWLGRRR